MSARNIYLVRHGQASFGTDDYDRLSPLGARQAQLAGEWFRRCGIDLHHAVAGGLKRHIQTAEAFFAGYDAEGKARDIERDAAFNEIDQLDILNPTHARSDKPLRDGTASKTFEDFRATYEPAFFRWLGGQFDHEYADPYHAYDARCRAAMQRLIERTAPGESAAVFTSGGTIGMICRHVLELSDKATSELTWVIGNTSVTHLRWERDRFVLKLFNSIAHLEHHGDASIVTLA